MKTNLLLILTLTLTILAPLTQAQGSGGVSGGACDFYRHQSVVAIVNVINAGDNEIWSHNPGCGIARSPTQVLEYSAVYNGPVLPAITAGTAAFAWSSAAGGGPVGCTFGAFTITSSSALGGSESEVYGTVTMTSNECHAIVTFGVNIIVAAVNVYQWRSSFPVNIRVEQAPYTYLCRATGITANAFAPGSTTCNEAQINGNQFNYLCDAPGIVPNSFNPATTTCNDPNFALSGQLAQLQYQCAASATTPNAFNPATNTCTTPQIDNQNRLCAASALGASCTTPTINEALSGTLTLSGTLNAVVSGTLDVLDRLCAAAPTGTTCTVATINTNAVSTTTITTAPGFWELFGPLLLAVAFVGLLSVMGLWVAPGGVALGFAIFLMAFKQPYQFLTLLQAVAGICLAIFCLIAIGIRVLGKKPKKKARRFFE